MTFLWVFFHPGIENKTKCKKKKKKSKKTFQDTNGENERNEQIMAKDQENDVTQQPQFKLVWNRTSGGKDDVTKEGVNSKDKPHRKRQVLFIFLLCVRLSPKQFFVSDTYTTLLSESPDNLSCLFKVNYKPNFPIALRTDNQLF